MRKIRSKIQHKFQKSCSLDLYQNSYMYRHLRGIVCKQGLLLCLISHNLRTRHIFFFFHIKRQFRNDRSVFAKQSNLNLFYFENYFFTCFSSIKMTFKVFLSRIMLQVLLLQVQSAYIVFSFFT